MENRIKRRLFVICLLGVIVLSIFGVQRKVIHTEPLDVDKLKPGDILFVDLYEGWHQGGFWDHLGIYVGEQDSIGEINGVVESTFSSGVISISLDSFIERDKLAGFSVRRLGDVPGRDEIIQQVIAYALSVIGTPFDHSATAAFPLKGNADNMHCVEVVWWAYKAAGIDLDSNGGLFLYPDDVFFSPRLEPVKE